MVLQSGQWIEVFNLVVDALPWVGAFIAGVVLVVLVVKNRPPE